MKMLCSYRTIILSLSSAAALGLAGCAQNQPPATSAPTSPLPAAAAAPINPNAGQGFSLPSSTRPAATGFTVYGASGPVNPPALSTIPAPASNGTSFNFVNANVSDVAHTIFAELLKQNYTVDGGVQGTITLQTTQPLPPDAVIPALETSLKMDNLALIREADGYHIAPMANAPADAAGTLSMAGGPQTPGYGYEIIPLKYASAEAIARLVQPLAQNGVQIQTDDARNLLIVAGTSQDRTAIAQNVAVFDVDWLSGMSYAMVPLQNAPAQAVSKEVGALIGGQNSPMAGMVKLVVVGQLNAILVITRQPQYLSEVRDLIGKFDQETQTTGRQVYIYHLQNGDAKNVAGLLNQLMGQGSAGQSGTAASNAGAPDNSDNSEASQSPDNTSGGVSASFGGTGGGAGQGGLPLPQMGQSQNSQSDTSPDDNAQVDDSGDDGSDDGQPPKITPDEDDNNLLIYATPDQYQSIQTALIQLDVQPKQVMLEAVVAEVDLTNSLRYGVQYFFQSGRVQSVNTLGTTAAVARVFPGFSALLAPGQNIQVALDALDSITHVNVISSPKLLVLNNQPAELDVGNEVPILTQSAQSTVTSTAALVNTVQYQNTGVILHVTPRISDGGLVTMDISQEVSDVSQTTSSSLDSPTISERKLSTIVAVPNGQTVALGGMIQDNNSKGNSGIPLLDRIPGLNLLFSNKNNSENRTELLVLITPHVVASDSALQDVTDEVRQQLGEVSTTQ